MDDPESSETDTEKYKIVEDEGNDESRRSFMKKGALASGALAVGLASTDSAAAQDGQQQVLVFTYNYYPSTTFSITQPLQASTTVNVLRRRGGGTVPEISQPDDYTGYVINYRLGGGNQAAGITTLLFTRGDGLNVDQQYRLSGDAQIFSSTLNLLSTTVRGTGGN